MSNSSTIPTYSNSTLSLFHQCPPGLGDGGCDQATCNSTFVEPSLRTLKSDNATSCNVCDEGFSGLNCNVCQGVQSCANRQLQANRGIRGISTSSSSYGQSNSPSSFSINNTLTCDNQPKAITASYLQCEIEQPTLSALFPGNITISGIKVANVPNFTSTGMGAWDAQANSSYLSVFLDGVEQFYCQAQGCSSTNTTSAVQASTAKWGTDLWTCQSFSCSCIQGTKICSNPSFPLGNIIDSIGGSLDFPCDYVNPNEPLGQSQCKLSTAALNQFVGPNGLALDQCSFGECLSQYALEQDWQQSALQIQSSSDKLSNGVIAGLAILGAAVLAFFCVFAFGYYLRRKASRLPRIDDQRAIGICWTNIHYYALRKKKRLMKPVWMKSQHNEKRKAVNELYEMEQARKSMEGREIEQSPTKDQKSELSSVEGAEEYGTLSNENHCHILRGITSYALPGTLNFIIGPSGAGKSSLVDVLAGRQKRGKVNGSLAWLSNFELTSLLESNVSQRRIALVDQDDSINLPAYMTVREVLSFAGELSTPENVAKQVRTKIVDETMAKLGLTDIADQRIGDVRTRGISGGERRRVSLAFAMVGRPKILIADECTSGLDAFSAQRVITALRELACGSEGGTTVIATLHQPSSQVFDLADHVILLSHGEILFDGTPSSSLEFCQNVGVPVPPGHNVADHLLTYAFEKPLKHVNTISRTNGGMVRDQQTGEETNQMGQVEQSSNQESHARSTQNKESSLLHNFDHTGLPVNHSSTGTRPVTTFITQLHALTARSLLMTKREMTGALAHIVGSIIIAIFVGGCFYKVQLNLGGFQNRVGSMFFVMILLLFLCLSALVNLAKMRLLMMRERANGLYSPWSWVAAHLVYDLLLLRAIPAILITCIVYWMVGFKASASDFFEFMLITVIFAWVIAIYNMTLAALIEDLSTAILLAALFVLFNIFMAGFLMSLDSMPPVVRWLRWIVPAKYALEAVADVQLKNLLFVDTFAGVPVKTDVSLFANKLFGFDEGAFYRDLIILACGFLVGFSAFLFATVWWRMRELR